MNREDKSMTYEVNHRPERRRFELEKEGMTAFVEYELEDGTLDVMHTIVPPPLEGQGIASALVEATYNYAAKQGLEPKATCSYAVAWLKRHLAKSK